MANDYYNTTNLKGNDLKDSIYNAMTQNQKIEIFFTRNPKVLFTPFEVWQAIFDTTVVPLTSVRRSMSNLEDAGILEKTETLRKGGYGKPNYCWKLK